MTSSIVLSDALMQRRQAIARDLNGDSAFLMVPGESFEDRASGELFFIAQQLRGHAEYGDFLVGEKARALSALNPEGDPSRTADLLAGERAALVDSARRHLDGESVDLLEGQLRELYRPLECRPATGVRVLFIGDCLGREIQGFLHSACLKRGLDADVTHVGGKTGYLIRESVRRCARFGHDAIFYSPVTHESMPALTRASTRPWATGGSLQRIARSAAAEAIETLEWLRAEFPGVPIFVHNATLLLRDEHADGRGVASALRSSLKRILTRSARRTAAGEFNAVLGEYIAAQPPGLGPHLIDEAELVARVGERRLRGVLYNVPDIHPTRLGQHLAPLYAAKLGAARLRSKKVFVTDLDNTLWKGLIGEGAVTHLPERQRALKALRAKGYLIAISSKNDSKNVRWNEMLLAEDDVVAQRVNWNPKDGNIRAIAAELNLKLKDFVFIDDSPQERALVQQGIPELLSLDATDPATWEELETLARVAPEPGDMDRTQMYLERKRRGEFLEPVADDPTRHLEALAALGLQARIEIPDARSSSRVAELLNRTSQFNLTGLRVTEEDIEKREPDPSHPVLVASVRDKFGDCGIVSVALLSLTDEAVEVDALVLSCRVFGFGVERAMMNAIKRYASAAQRSSIAARLVVTSHNQPCHSFLGENGFTEHGERWTCSTLTDIADPPWLSVSGVDALAERGTGAVLASRR